MEYKKALETLTIEYLNREQGLPSGQIQDVTVDANGRLWLATPAGLTIYDGSRSTVLTTKHGLKTHGLRSVETNLNQQVLVGSDAGLDVVNPDFTIDTESSLEWSEGLVDCIVSQPGKSTHIGTTQGLYNFNGDAWKAVDQTRLNYGIVVSMCSDKNNEALWAVASGGTVIFVLNDNLCKPTETTEWREVGRVTAITHTVGEYMAVGGDQGFAEINRQGRVVTRPLKLTSRATVSAIIHTNNRLWVGQGKNLCAYIRQGEHWVASAQATVRSSINALSTDSSGTLWIATDGHGLGKITTADEIVCPVYLPISHSVFAIKPSCDGGLLAVGDRTAWRLSSDSKDLPRRISALDDQVVWDIIEQTDGTLYAATSTGLIRVEAQGTHQLIGRNDAVLSAPGRCLLPIDRGLLVGTLQGCALLRPGQARQHLCDADGRKLGYVYSMVQDQAGHVWIGTLGRGLWKLNGDHCIQISGQGLREHSSVYAIAVGGDNSLAIVQDSAIYIQSERGDVRCLVVSEEPIAGWSLAWDLDGSLWAGTAAGLVHYNSEDGHILRRVTMAYGVSNWEFTSSRSLYIRGGVIYCGLNSGLIKVNRTALLAIEHRPIVNLNQVSFSNAEIEEKEDCVIISQGNWSMVVEVYATWSLDQSSVRYVHRMLGFSDEWSQLSSSSRIRYNSLPAGEYQLEVRSYSTLVGYGPTKTVLNLVVEVGNASAHWWSTPRQMLLRRAKQLDAVLFRHKRLTERNLELERALSHSQADLKQTRKQLDFLIAEHIEQKDS